VWAGTGTKQQLKGFTVMTGNSSSTVSGQTLALTANKIYDQWQQVGTNLGALPDLVVMAPRRAAALDAATDALGLPLSGIMPPGSELVVSPAAPLTLGGGTEDWILLVNRLAAPLVADPEPRVEFYREGPSGGNTLQFRWVLFAFAALGVSKRPEGVGIVKGLTTPVFT
jgi:hypothetical protein